MSELSGRTAWLNSVLASDDDTIDSITIAVACVLQRHMNAELVCHPSTRRIAAMARCSRNVAMDRVARLEKAGLLIVERHRRAVSVFQGLIPDGESGSPHEPDGGPGSPDEPGDLAHPMSQIPESGSPDEPDDLAHLMSQMSPGSESGSPDEPVASSGSPDEPDDLAHPMSQIPESGSPDEPVREPVAQSGSSGGHRSKEEVSSSSSSSGTQTTHERKRNWEPRTEPSYTKGQRVTRTLLWRTMAWRRLALDRELGRDNLPPPGSYREVRLLETLEADFATQHNDRALKLKDRLPPNDLERWIYELAPELSRFGWDPHLRAGNAEHKAWKAESDARMAKVTPEEHEQIALGLRELREKIRSGRHLQVVETEAS